jgi:copper resistance protein D
MARFLQIFGFFSVLLRGATLSLQSLTIGGIVFLNFVAPRAIEDTEAFEQASRRWIGRFALALAAAQTAFVTASSVILMESAEMTLRDVSGAMFFFAGVISATSALIIAIAIRSSPARKDVLLLLPAALLIAASAMTSHAMARLDYRAPLVALTILHQSATATWLGGLPFLLIALRRGPGEEFARRATARFSQLALASVAVLATAGAILAYSYVGSLSALYGTSYGAMVATKAALFGLLLLLGALNFKIVRQSAVSKLGSLGRLGEAEIGIGLTVILTAASLTSLPPAADLVHDRVSAVEIAARMAPSLPRFTSPPTEALPLDDYAAQKEAYESGSALAAESFVPGQGGLRPNTPAEKGWSEYNHHWAGIAVVAIGLLALLAQSGRAGWARNWPLIFLGLSAFLFLRSDPEVWPNGPNGFWISTVNPEVLLHRIFAVLVIALAVFEWRVQTGRVASASTRLIFPMLVAASGALLLTHSHSLGNIKEEVLAELSHIPLAVLAVTAGWSRWLELRLPAENRMRTTAAWLWPLCFVLIGAALLNYREM